MAHTRCGFATSAASGPPVDLFYEHASSSAAQQPSTRVLFIMGLAATSTCWRPQIDFLVQQALLLGVPLAAAALDNRGVGRSGSPEGRQHYSTAIMAADARAVMDALGWPDAHIVGFSMGTMIATKLAAATPERVRSLTLLAAVGGGMACVPRSLAALKACLRCALARTPRDRAAADLRLHFTSRALRAQVVVSHYQHTVQAEVLEQCEAAQQQERADLLAAGQHASPGLLARRERELVARQKDVLLEEYLAMAEAMPAQPPHGAAGQLHAVWAHKLSSAEVAAISRAPFARQLIHGRHDLVASPRFAHGLAEALEAPFIELPGAHFVSRESAAQVNALLAGVILQPALQPGPLAGAAARTAADKLPTASSADAGSRHSSSHVRAAEPHQAHLAILPIAVPAAPRLVIDARCCSPSQSSSSTSTSSTGASPGELHVKVL